MIYQCFYGYIFGAEDWSDPGLNGFRVYALVYRRLDGLQKWGIGPSQRFVYAGKQKKTQKNADTYACR